MVESWWIHIGVMVHGRVVVESCLNQVSLGGLMVESQWSHGGIIVESWSRHGRVTME